MPGFLPRPTGTWLGLDGSWPPCKRRMAARSSRCRLRMSMGPYGNDRLYMEQIRQSLVRAGLRRLHLLYLRRSQGAGSRCFAGGSSGHQFRSRQSANGPIPTRFLGHAVSGVDDGAFHFNQPWMTGEYWAGWYDAWGGEHAQTDAGATGKGSGLDAGSRVFGQSVHVSWGNQLRVYEWRQFWRWTDTFPWSRATTTMLRWTRPADPRGSSTCSVMLFSAGRASRHLPCLLRCQSPACAGFQLTESAPLWSNLPAPVSCGASPFHGNALARITVTFFTARN